MFLAAEALRKARMHAGLSASNLARLADCAVSTISRIEAGQTQPSVDVMAQLLDACKWRLIALPDDPESLAAMEVADMPTPPATYPNPRNDDPWDNDAVHWLLTQAGVSSAWKRGPLFECLRRQPGRLKNEPHRVEAAARLATKHGVRQLDVYDASIGKTIVRLVRTDPAAPTYPASYRLSR